MIQDALNREIESALDQIHTLPVDSEGYEKAVKSLAVLMDRKASMEDASHKRKVDSEKSCVEQDMEERRFKHEKRNDICKNILTAAGIAVPAVLAVWGTVASLEFEKTNSVTTILGKDWLKKVIPKK